MAHAVPPPPPPQKHYLDAAHATADDVIADLRTHGFCIVRNVLSAAEAADKHAELTATLDRTATPAGRNPFEGFSTRRLYALFGKTRCFDAPALHPLALDVAKGVLGEHLQLNSVVGIEIRPGERAQGMAWAPPSKWRRNVLRRQAATGSRKCCSWVVCSQL